MRNLEERRANVSRTINVSLTLNFADSAGWTERDVQMTGTMDLNPVFKCFNVFVLLRHAASNLVRVFAWISVNLFTFSTIFRRVLILRIHQPTPTALSSDHCGSPLCMAGIMLSSSSSASEWKAHAKWHVDRPGTMTDTGEGKSRYPKFRNLYFIFSFMCHGSSNMSSVLYLGGAAACGT